MSSNASTNSQSSSEESLPDSLSNLKPYDWEPRCSASEVDELMKKQSSNSKTEDSSDKDAEDKRIGNTDWCRCGCCRPMGTYTESLCGAETNEVPEECFEGMYIKLKTVNYNVSLLQATYSCKKTLKTYNLYSFLQVQFKKLLNIRGLL